MSEEVREFTPEQLDALLQQEGDKRVTSALATARAKWQKEQEELLVKKENEWKEEYERKATLSAEEKAKEEMQEQINALAKQSDELAKRENILSAKEKLNSANISSDEYKDILDVLVSSDKEATNKNVDNFISILGNTKQTLETKIREELTKVPPPSNNGGGDKEMDKSQFNKLSYADKVKLKSENPELFKKLIK